MTIADLQKQVGFSANISKQVRATASISTRHPITNNMEGIYITEIQTMWLHTHKQFVRSSSTNITVRCNVRTTHIFHWNQWGNMSCAGL